MLRMILILSHEVIQVDQDNVNEFMETKFHGPLKSGYGIFKAKRHDTIPKGAPGGSENGFVLILFLYLNLVITIKTIHEWKDFMVVRGINDMVNE